MVGALADWFAVTALFRHPLGLKIPHTAIIPRKKDQLGRAWALSCGRTSCPRKSSRAKLRDAEIASRLGKWLSEPDHAARVASETSTVLPESGWSCSTTRTSSTRSTARSSNASPNRSGVRRWAGCSISCWRRTARRLIQLLADRVFEWALNAGPTIERVVLKDSPSWSPKFVDQLVGDRIHRELMDFTDKVRRNPQHELRQSANRFLFEFANDLQTDPPPSPRPRASRNSSWSATRSRARGRDGMEDPQTAGARRWTIRRALCRAGSPTRSCRSESPARRRRVA